MSNDPVDDPVSQEINEETLNRWAFYFFLSGIASALLTAAWMLLRPLLL